jgi:D-3-phosphoglycerate dehydrogenase / 2-oxoglutarate reductase
MDAATNLKMISRVGIGLNSVDLIETEKQDIIVPYTPYAPDPAVSELTIGLILTLLHSVQLSNMEMHSGQCFIT